MTEPADSFRVHIRLADSVGSDRLTDIVRGLGGDVLPGSAETPTAELMIVDGKQLEHLDRWDRCGIDLSTIVMWVETGQHENRDLLKSGVFDVIGPGLEDAAIRESLERALADFRQRQARFQDIEETSEKYGELSMVVRLSLDLGAELNVDRVLNQIVDQIHNDLGFGIVSIMLLDDDGKYLTIRASRGLDRDIQATSKVPLGEGVAGSVAEKGEPLLIRDIEDHPTFRKLHSHGRYSSKSLICVPLKVGDRVIGVLNGNNRRGRDILTEHDLRLLRVYAAQASVIIERARLYRNLENKADELSGAYSQLKALDRIKSDFITNVSHEYRTPVTVILGYLELLKSTVQDPSQEEKVNITMEAAHRLARLVDDSTDMLRLDSGTMPFSYQSVDAEEFFRDVLQKFWSSFGSRGVDLVLDIPDGLPAISMDVGKMRKVLDKLLDNSLKFTPSGGYVKIACAVDSGWITVTVEDSGPGIPIGDRERAFERFEQGGDIMTSKPQGTGLGLPIASTIVARHGGKLWLDDGFTDGCRIQFTLPTTAAEGGDEGDSLG